MAQAGGRATLFPTPRSEQTQTGAGEASVPSSREAVATGARAATGANSQALFSAGWGEDRCPVQRPRGGAVLAPSCWRPARPP